MIPRINPFDNLQHNAPAAAPTPIPAAVSALNQERRESPALDERVSKKSKPHLFQITYYCLDKIRFVYEGEMLDGKYHGDGCLSDIENGSRYKGQFKDGLRHGKGIYSFEALSFKSSLEGEFVNGEPVNGTLRFVDGSYYSGSFNDWQAHGQGTHTSPNGFKYSGEFKMDKVGSYGTFTYPDGSIYTGELRDGKKNGCGILTGPLGHYEGWWENDQKVIYHKSKIP